MGLIAPCRVQLLSLNQPYAAISGVRRAKRLQPAISFRLSPAIKHLSPIGGHASARRACTETVSGNSAAWMASPGGDVRGGPRRVRPSSARPRRPRTVILSDGTASGIRCANVCRQVRPLTPTQHRSARHVVMTSFVTICNC